MRAATNTKSGMHYKDVDWSTKDTGYVRVTSNKGSKYLVRAGAIEPDKMPDGSEPSEEMSELYVAYRKRRTNAGLDALSWKLWLVYWDIFGSEKG